MSKRPGDRRGENPASLANLRLFTPGNQASRQHGGYARHFSPEVVEAATDTDPGDSVGRLEELITLERLRLHSTLAAKARWDARGDFEQAIDRAVGRLLALIAEQERIAASPAAVAARLSEVLDDAEAAGLDAAATAEACERAGIAPPFSLQQRVRAELATLEPPEPEGGMTDDELERLSAEYEQRMSDEPRWLEDRHQQVQEIHKQRDKERNA